jgi:hypothetical protein
VWWWDPTAICIQQPLTHTHAHTHTQQDLACGAAAGRHRHRRALLRHGLHARYARHDLRLSIYVVHYICMHARVCVRASTCASLCLLGGSNIAVHIHRHPHPQPCSTTGRCPCPSAGSWCSTASRPSSSPSCSSLRRRRRRTCSSSVRASDWVGSVCMCRYDALQLSVAHVRMVIYVCLACQRRYLNTHVHTHLPPHPPPPPPPPPPTAKKDDDAKARSSGSSDETMALLLTSNEDTVSSTAVSILPKGAWRLSGFLFL